jgi:hypothetical protein
VGLDDAGGDRVALAVVDAEAGGVPDADLEAVGEVLQ